MIRGASFVLGGLIDKSGLICMCRDGLVLYSVFV